MNRRLLVTNDDGYRSFGLRSLVNSLSKSYDVTVVAPDGPRSASGLALTFYRPLRVREFNFNNVPYYAVNGMPGDCVSIGLFHILKGNPPDMVVSGINIGENVSMLEFFMSGTVAAAIYASIHDIPAIAFSKRVEGVDVLSPDQVVDGFDEAGEIAKVMVDVFIEAGFPRQVNLINVNFPARLSKDSRVVVTRLARRSIDSKVYVRKDPRGRPYYWIWGDKRASFRRGTDAYEVIKRNNISVTPITLGLQSDDAVKSLRGLADYITERVRNLFI